MSFIGSMLGQNSSGANWKAGQAGIQESVNQNDIDAAKRGAAEGISQQRDLLAALQAQGGIQNQSSVFNQQQALADTLGDMSRGGGPNPAAAALAQATSNNVAQQNALMASQRGAGANVGLIGRQAAMQGGNLQQQAAGQAATMQAQQQLNAIGALQNQQGQMANLSTAQVGQQANATNAFNQAVQAQQNAMLGARAQHNQALIANQSQMNQANAGMQQQLAKGQQEMVKSAVSAAGGLAGGGAGFAEGGEVKSSDPLAVMKDQQAIGAQQEQSGPKSSFAKAMASLSGADSGLKPGEANENDPYGGKQIGHAIGSGIRSLFTSGSGPSVGSPQAPMAGEAYSPAAIDSAAGVSAPPVAMAAFGGSIFNSGARIKPEAMASGGKVPVLLSPGEKVLTPGSNKLKKVPGKAKVKGDSEKNDTYATSLAEGSIVVPRTKANDKDKTMEFINAVMSRSSKLKKGKK